MINNPYPYSYNNKRYKTFDYEMKSLFGCKVAKVPIDINATCPNIDGKVSHGGCIYCSRGKRRDDDVIIQFHEKSQPLIKKWGNKDGHKLKFIPYFQQGSNTYKCLDTLKKSVSSLLKEDNVIGISIATRSDCLDDDVIEYLKYLDSITYLTIELGLQTSNDKTAKLINRGQTYHEFLIGYYKLSGLKTAIHIINGLPGEKEEDMIKTAVDVSLIDPYEIKIHSLFVLQNTVIAEMYNDNIFKCITLDDYVSVISKQLQILSPNTVIGRVTGDPPMSSLIAPQWCLKKVQVINEIDKFMASSNVWQGKLYNMHKK